MFQEDFIASIAPAAKGAMGLTGVPASVTIAQAILESNWGKSQCAIIAKNVFGIKADLAWHGQTIELPTREFLKGVWVTVPAIWRKYDTLKDSIFDHANFLKVNKRYANMFPFTTVTAFSKYLLADGYATDPAYPEKLTAIISSRKLEQYDI